MNDSSILNLAQESKTWNRSQKIDAVLSVVALSQIVLSTLQGSFIALGMPEDTASFYRIILSALTIIISIPFLLKRNIVLVVVTYLIAFLVYIIHLIVFPATVEFWKAEAFRFTLPISVPIALCVILIEDKYIFYHYLKIVAYFTGFLSLIYGLRVFLGYYDLGFSYNQGYGYMLLFPIIVLFYQGKKFSLVFAAVLFLLLLLYGARGPLLSLVVFFSYVLISKKQYGYCLLLVAIAIIGLPVLDSILESYGLSSRTLDLYLSGNLDADNGRNAIKAEIMKGIEQNPYGWGLFGDRVITHGANNAHNFIREILCEFGLYLGTIVLLLFFFQILKRFLIVKGGDRDIFALFFCACFIPTLVSGSYLTSTNFAIFVGIMFLLPRYWSSKVRYNIVIK